MNLKEMEYYPYNLEKYLANSYDFEMNTEQINKILFILTKTLSSLHRRDIVHGDFKAKNIMLDKELNPIVIDFDLSETETKESDIRKFHILIYQLLYKVEYKPSVYNNYKRIMNKIDNDHPLIGNAIKKDNILFILEVFWIFNKKKDTLNLSNHELIKKQVLKTPIENFSISSTCNSFVTPSQFTTKYFIPMSIERRDDVTLYFAIIIIMIAIASSFIIISTTTS